LNYENSKVVNFTSLRNIILEDAPPVHVHNTKKIKRKHGGLVVSKPDTKEYKVVFKKRRLMDNFDSALWILVIYFIFLFLYKYRYPCTIKSFYSMTLKLQHLFTLIVAGPSSCGKSTFVIRLLECRKQLCAIAFENIVS
jgi:ABC-type microcin C transport system duplicated ATPase subunit YejF